MTKLIRVENADINENYRVEVQHQELLNGTWNTVRSEEVFRCQIKEINIYAGKRIVVQEIEKEV